MTVLRGLEPPSPYYQAWRTAMVRWLSLFSQQGRGFIDDLTQLVTEKQFGATTGRNTPLSTDVFLEEFDGDEPDGV